MAQSSGGGGPGGSVLRLGEGGRSEYKVRLSKNVGEKTYHMMRFKPPHKCDIDKLINPTLERQIATKVREEELPESGEGSEYGRKRREEARRRRRGHKDTDPDDYPWVLQERKKGGKHFIGRKEGTVNSNSSYFVFKIQQDGTFEVEPVKNWYDFVPPVKYNYFDADEAEAEFEKRNKTLNYFSVMLSKKMKNSEEGEEEEGLLPADGRQARKKEKKKAADSGLLLTDSDSAGFSSENDSDDSSGPPRRKSKSSEAISRHILKKKKKRVSEVEEAGEETDEGDMESREVDYMSDSSSNSELEFLAKEANKELPKDDQEIERKEEKEIDQGFLDSSSSEDELTEKGKELREIMKKKSGGDKGSDEEEEPEEGEGEGEERMSVDEDVESAKGSPSSSPSRKGKSGKSSSKKHSKKRERDTGSPATAKKPATMTPEDSPDSSTGGGGDAAPPGKKQKMETSTSSITEEEVKRYLMRRPITAKDLVKKFTSKKTDMDRNQIVVVLHKIIGGLENVEKQAVKDKMYLSLKNPDS